MKNATPYTPLPFRGSPPLSLFKNQKGRLWLAEDHILVQEMTAYGENARRFFFRDIQLITITPTRRAGQTIGGSIACILLVALVIGLITSYSGESNDWPAVLIAAIAWFSIPLLLLGWVISKNVIAGQTCACVIHTAVQQQQIVALNRMKTATRFMAFIEPYLVAAQGNISPVQFQETPVDSAPLLTQAPLRPAAAARPAAPKPPLKPAWHVALFVFYLLLGLSGIADFFIPSETKDTLDGFFLLALLPVLVVAIIRQHMAESPLDLRWYAWLGAANIFFSMTAGIFIVSYYTASSMAPFMMMEDIETRIMMGWPGFQALILFYSLFSLAVGGLGLRRIAQGVAPVIPPIPPVDAAAAPPLPPQQSPPPQEAPPLPEDAAP